MRLSDLERKPEMLNTLALDDPTVEPAGPMAAFVGPLLTFDQMVDAYDANEPERWELGPGLVAVLGCIRSFPVASLIGRTITCPPPEFGDHLRQFLMDALPGTTWDEQDFDPQLRPLWERRMGLVEKYHLLDGHWAAPGDEATGQAMMLELGGRVGNIGGPSHENDTFHVRGPDGQFRDATPEEWASIAHLAECHDPFTTTVQVTIEHAQWTNVSGLRVGTGYYE